MRLLERHEKPALILKDQQVSYRQLLERIQAYAALFEHEHYEKAAIYSENRLEWVYAFYAAWKNRCIAVPIDFMATADEAAYMLGDCTPEVIFCSREKLPDAERAVKSLSYTPKLMVFEEIEDSLRTQEIPQNIDFPESVSDATAVIIYTSGTTGSPKGAMLSYDNLLANIEGVSRDVPIYTPDQRVLVLLPLHHVFPLLGTIVMPLSTGGTCIFSPSMASEDILNTLNQHGITIIVSVPRFYNLIRKGIMDKIRRSAAARMLFKLAETVDSPALSKTLFKTVHQKFGGKLQFMVCGGAAIENEVARDFKTLGFDLLIGFGMTEAAPMISFTRPGTLRIGASGQALPTNEVKIVEEEILARGRSIMQGYYHRPEETAAVLRDGWLYTGDLGHIDNDGFVFVTGRKKDIIVLSNGKNINPEEIEFKILKEFDSVREIGVFMHDNLLQAVIFPDFQKLHDRGVHQISEFIRWDVMDKYNQAASPAKKIARFTVVKQELPKTRLSKIRRFQLPSLIQTDADTHPPQTEPDYPEYQMIKNFLHEQTGRSIFPDHHLELDLGLDSLDKVSLMTFLHSTFGIDMQDQESVQLATVEKIAAYVREKKVKMDFEGVNWQKILHQDVSLELPKSSFLHLSIHALVKFLLSHFFKLTATGLENLPNSPCIFAANHQSYIDAFLIVRFFDATLVRQSYFYAEERHFNTRWLQWFAAHHNVIIVNINRDLKLSLQKMAAVLNSGGNIVIFPEGTRTRDGRMAAFKKTFAILSGELNIPIVPVVLQGAYEAMPTGQRLPKFGQPISVTFLPPILPEGLSHEALTEKVAQTIAGHLSA